jgi:hypothetical protein
MAAGKQAGEYSFKFTSFTLVPGPGGSIPVQCNCEGSGTGYGTVLGTLTAVGGNGGTLSWCSHAFLENGDRLLGVGSGTYESSGKNRWRTQLVVQISDGRSLVAEGEVDLATRSWSGKLFEQS